VCRFVNVQVVLGLRNGHLFKEDIAHILVVVLTGMNDDLGYFGMFCYFAAYNGCFDKLRPRSYYCDYLHCLFASFAFEHDVPGALPEVFPVGGVGVFEVGLEVFGLAGFDLLEGGWHVGVVWRDETRLYEDAELLELYGVKIVIVSAERAHADELEVAPEPVDDHRELVEPGLSQELAVPGDAEVVGELAAGSEVVVLVDVWLEVFRVWIHCPHLVDADYFAAVADSPEADQKAGGRRVVADRFLDLGGGDAVFAALVVGVGDVEAGAIDAAHHADFE